MVESGVAKIFKPLQLTTLRSEYQYEPTLSQTQLCQKRVLMMKIAIIAKMERVWLEEVTN
jgi:hypothetical protein